MADNLYQKFVRHWQEVTDVPPQNLGILTPYYKKTVAYLKEKPWLAFVITGFLTVFFLYLVLGSAIVIITSVLQRGI
jgi:hypothetical protein